MWEQFIDDWKETRRTAMTRDGAILRLERERDFSKKMEKSWSQVDWKDRPDHLADPRALSANHRMYADALDMAIAALREQPRWISVEERLPEVGQRVLVCSLYDLQNIGWLLGDGRWQIKTSYPDTPTHWMPLPEPPEEVDNA